MCPATALELQFHYITSSSRNDALFGRMPGQSAKYIRAMFGTALVRTFENVPVKSECFALQTQLTSWRPPWRPQGAIVSLAETGSLKVLRRR